MVEQTRGGWRERLDRPWSKRLLALVVTLALVATTLVAGEPNRPATATVVRPIVTVQALCTAPTIIDVAAGEPTRGLSAINALLGLESPLVAEVAREVTIAETDAGTFFIWIRDGELRLSILRPTGLPALADAGPDSQPQTYRAFDLPVGLTDLDPVVVPDDDAVFVLFAGVDDPVSAIRLELNTLISDSADLSAGRAPDGVEMTDPASRPGAATAHARVLWVAADDGAVWAYDPAVDASDRWAEVDQGLDGGVLASDGDLLYGVFSQEGEGVEVRGFSQPGADPVHLSFADDGVAVEAASFPRSKRPAFVLRDEAGEARVGLLHITGQRADVVWSEGAHTEHPTVGAVVHDEAAALLTEDGGTLAYHVTDRDGGYLGAFHRAEDESDCVSVPDWSDAADVITPLSAGPFLHLHDPSSQFDCVVDTRGDLADLEANCAPDGPWSVDKGAAPDSDFTIEVERAVEEFRDDRDVIDEEEAPEDPEVEDEPAQTGPERLEDEFADVGLGIQEVDEDLTEVCAEEEVTAVVSPELDALEPVGDSGIRIDWTWAGGRCLPERYDIDICMVSSDGSGCVEERTVEVHDRDGASNRLSYDVSSRPGRSYRVAVTAIKKGITSSPSNVLTVTTPPTVPAPPSGVSAELSSRGVWTISWESCLDDRSCDQRPEGFRIAVQGCDGDSLQRLTHDVGNDQRSVSYDVSDGGFRGNDLLGRRVRFTVAATAAGYDSDAVDAGSCRESVRPGISVAYGNAPVEVSLSGRTTRMTLEGPRRGRGLTRLFGTSTYDDVSARLVRSSSSTSSRNGALESSVNFDVQRCELRGWTVELTPRRGGSSLTNHRARITGVPAACDWAVTDGTQASAKVIGGDEDAIKVDVTIPGLTHDVRTDKVDSVSAEVECRPWHGGSPITPTASGGEVDGDKVTFTVSTPAVFDLRDACTIAPRIHGNDGETVVPERDRLDLRPAAGAVFERIAPTLIATMRDGPKTGEYRGTRLVDPLQRHRELRITSGNHGVPCEVKTGAGTLRIRMTADRHADRDCRSDVHRIDFDRHSFRDSSRVALTYEVRFDGRSISDTVQRDVCSIPGSIEPPCEEIDECAWQEGMPADDPECFEPCWWDPDIPADDQTCPERCEWDPDLPADDPDCVEPPDEEPPEEPGDPEEPGEPGDPEDPGDDPGDPGDEDPGDGGDDP